MMPNFMEQLQLMKMKMEEAKEKLDTVFVSGEAAGGDLKVTMNGNKKVKSVYIAPALQFSSSEELEEQLCVAFNRAMEQADLVHEKEMKGMASGILPPGLF
jgi:nucleoid-associated protein EbfC